MIKIRCITPDKPLQFTLLTGKTYTVGRKNCDISFPDDQSISRNHAEVCVEHPAANTTDPLLVPTVVVKDLGSKFGTFANDGIERKSKMAMREGLTLSTGDRFKFGLQWNLYEIEYTPLVVTHSSVKDQSLKNLKYSIMRLGGHVVQEWSSSCDYLVMESLSLTLKAVCALLAGKYIVTPAFFKDYLEGLEKGVGKGIPSADDYLPPLAEKNIGSGGTFEPITGRCELFKDKVFLFCSHRHLNKMRQAVETGGGKCQLVTETPESDLMKENYLLMKPPDRDMMMFDVHVKQSVDKYKKKKRLIQDAEIGLAAVFMTCEHHCNPCHFFGTGDSQNLNMDRVETQSQNPERLEVVVPETQPETQNQAEYTGRNIVQETLVEEKPDQKVKAEVKVKPEALKREAAKEPANGGPSASKKRPATETLSSGTARQKRSKADTQTQKSTLSRLFGMSDSEEEEDAIIPDSQQAETQLSFVNENETSFAQIDDEDGMIAASPEMFVTQEDDVIRPSQEQMPPPRRTSPRKRGSTVQETEPRSEQGTPIAAGSNKKRKQRTPTPETSPVKVEAHSSKKQKTRRNDTTEDLSEQAEKLTIKPDVKPVLNGENTFAPAISEIFVEFKPSILTPRIELVEGRTVKNFKSFRKEWPLSMRRHNITLSGNTTYSQELLSEPVPARQLTFEVFDGSSCSSGVLVDLISNLKNKSKREVPDQESSVQQDVTVNEMEVEHEFIVPEPTSSRPARGTRSTRQTQKSKSPQKEVPTRRQPARKAPIVFEDDDDDNFEF